MSPLLCDVLNLSGLLTTLTYVLMDNYCPCLSQTNHQMSPQQLQLIQLLKFSTNQNESLNIFEVLISDCIEFSLNRTGIQLGLTILLHPYLYFCSIFLTFSYNLWIDILEKKKCFKYTEICDLFRSLTPFLTTLFLERKS